MYNESVIASNAPVHSFAEICVQEEPAPRRVLVVEPDTALGLFLKRELRLKGFDVELCRDGEQALEEIRTAEYALIIQDLNLPKMDGMSLLHAFGSRCPQIPVVVLTARSRTEDMVQALEWGAHDYLVKPFSLLELQARMRNLLRRGALPAALPGSPARASQLTINKQERRVTRGVRTIDLTPREFALLEHLVDNEGKAVSRATLMQDVWNAPFEPGNNIVDVYMKYLRDKIDGEGEPKLIRTIRGVGYMLDPAAAATQPKLM